MPGMSGYELNDKDIETVLEKLQLVQPDATREDAIQLLQKTKMGYRELTSSNPGDLEKMYDALNSEESDKT